MTITERAEKAVQLKNTGGYNCSQAVTAVLPSMIIIHSNSHQSPDHLYLYQTF